MMVCLRNAGWRPFALSITFRCWDSVGTEHKVWVDLYKFGFFIFTCNLMSVVTPGAHSLGLCFVF